MAYGSFQELEDAAAGFGRLGPAVVAREADESAVSEQAVRRRLSETLDVMEAALAEGLAPGLRSRSGLTGGDAAALASARPRFVGPVVAEALAGALAVAGLNASMGRIVAAPTGGASGVLPGVLFATARALDAPRERLVDALAVAAAIGGVVAARATLSGAASGCQAEVGTASAMAAAAAVDLAGGSPAAVGHAASFALQGQLGLVCDPVGGLVEVPCVVRNATGAASALAAAEMALAGIEFPIPFDEVADAMAAVGRSLPPSLRETGAGGLAATPTGRALAAEARDRMGP